MLDTSIQEYLNQIATDVGALGQAMAKALEDATNSATSQIKELVDAFGITILDMDDTGMGDTTDEFNLYMSTPGLKYLGPGHYLVDAVKTIKPVSGLTLVMDPKAFLIVKPNDQTGYQVFNMHSLVDTHIKGGQIIGDRDQHTYTPVLRDDGTVNDKASTHEWGHGFKMAACVNCSVTLTVIRECTGDGISVGSDKDMNPWKVSQNITLDRVQCIGNRRQGLSITNVDGLKAYDCVFAETGVVNGTSPRCGVDFEPDNEHPTMDDPGQASWCRNVWLERCTMRDNAVYGVAVRKRVEHVTLKDCIVVGNRSTGVDNAFAKDFNVIGGYIGKNGSTGLHYGPDTSGTVAGVEFDLNYQKQNPVARPMPITAKGVVPYTIRDLLLAKDAVIDLETANTYH